ncbi:integral membrane sensor signal transduction histidine kinase [Leptolyngbya sp. NIES-3755]|nr:integral membrane sensor signal transduction histidine kinase [Leptolyngbya sp. NIES-3755]
MEKGNKQSANLSNLTIAELETKFAQAKRLEINEPLEEYLQNLTAIGNFAELFFTNQQGLNLAVTQETSDFVQRDEQWWQKGKQHQHWIGVPQFDDSTQKTTIDMVQAIVDPNTREFLGVMKAGYDVDALEHLKGELSNLELLDTERVQILALGKNLIPIKTITPSGMRHDREVLGKEPGLKQAANRLKAKKQPSSEEEFDIATELLIIDDRWYAVTMIPDTSWVAISSIEINQARAGSYQLMSIFALVFLGLGTVAAIVIVRVSQRFSKPLNELSQATQQITKQANFAVQIPVRTTDREICSLTDSFNQLIKRVQQLLNEQAEAKRQLEDYNQTLEDKVDARTQELKEALNELKRTQAKIVQSEKMSSLGQLVAGIAHEINNPVNFIHGNLGHVQENIQDLLDLIELYQSEYQATIAIANKIEEIDLAFLQDDVPKLLNSMTVGTERIREIVKSLRIFSRLDEAEVKAIDIHEGIDSTLMILQNRLKAKPDRAEIQVIKDYAELPMVQCYAGQLNQVFMNILVNAIDALEEGLVKDPTHQPHIKIGTKQMGESIEIAISDNGTGIPESVQSRIFDPFFTTKAVGKGTGMGMSISYQIITEKHGGELECVSTPGQGTLFLIRIPIEQNISEPGQTQKID